MTENITAIIITKDTAIAGKPVEASDELLIVGEHISHSDAKELVRVKKAKPALSPADEEAAAEALISQEAKALEQAEAIAAKLRALTEREEALADREMAVCVVGQELAEREAAVTAREDAVAKAESAPKGKEKAGK